MLIGLCVVRNEGDIIGQVLRHAAPHHDLVLVVDVASTDGTGLEVEAVGREHRHVVAIGRLAAPVWPEGVHRHVWARFRDRVPDGTWWSLVDGDEFAEEPLREVVREAEGEGADHVQGAFATFAYTEGEARAWREGRETLADRMRPIEERRRFYRITAYSIRLFREHTRLRWNRDTYHPAGLIRPMRRRVCYRHYQHRDLDQLEIRLRTRQDVDVPDWHRQMHYHWHYTVEEALHPDGDPDLREHVPGRRIRVGDELPKVWVKDPFRRTYLRLWRAWAARVPQAASALFADIPVEDVLCRAKGA